MLLRRDRPADLGRREVSMRVDSAHQIRVVVLPKSARSSNAEISKIVKRDLVTAGRCVGSPGAVDWCC
jgi:hypothetical protein